MLDENRELNSHVWSTSAASDGSAFIAHGLTLETQLTSSMVICVDPKLPKSFRWRQKKERWENIFPIINSDNRKISYMQQRKDGRISVRIMDVRNKEPVKFSVQSLGRIVGPQKQVEGSKRTVTR